MARGLPWLQQGLPFLAVCLELLPCLAAALALFFKVHLGNGKMFLREKKAKQQFPDLMKGKSDRTLPPLLATFISHVMLFAAKSPLKKIYEGHFPPWQCVWSQRQGQATTLFGAHGALPAPFQQRTGAHGASLVPLLGHGAWLCLVPLSSHIYSSDTWHCGVTDLAGVLFTPHTPAVPGQHTGNPSGWEKKMSCELW